MLDIRGLSTEFETRDGRFRAVDNLHLKVERGKTVGLVGESGCGKSMLAYSILRLVPPPGRVVAGEVMWKGRDLHRLPENELRKVRGREIALIFQEPSAALNPVLSIGDQVSEPLRIHLKMGRKEAKEKAAELLRAVRIPDPVDRLADYPHQMSGGMKQRVLIAMAIACSPDLLIADEPTTALDVTVQAQILDLAFTFERGVRPLSHSDQSRSGGRRSKRRPSRRDVRRTDRRRVFGSRHLRGARSIPTRRDFCAPSRVRVRLEEKASRPSKEPFPTSPTSRPAAPSILAARIDSSLATLRLLHFRK